MWLLLVLLVPTAAAPLWDWHCPEPNETWCDPAAPLPQRVASLVSRLTFAEQVAQLQTTHNPPLDVPGYVPRLGLEAYTTRECLHGVQDDDVTVFPQSISLAATFDAELLRDVGAAIGREARGLRNRFEAARPAPGLARPPPALTCFAPQINIARDPRWGRAQETYGECPFLTARLARAYVAGLQGNHSAYLQAVATPKHFDAYGGATSPGRRSITEVVVSWQDWHETFLPAFFAVLAPPGAGAGAASAMCSYNSLCVVDSYADPPCPGPSHGVPACADGALLSGLLREQWKFDGYVIGDAGDCVRCCRGRVNSWGAGLGGGGGLYGCAVGGHDLHRGTAGGVCVHAVGLGELIQPRKSQCDGRTSDQFFFRCASPFKKE